MTAIAIVCLVASCGAASEALITFQQETGRLNILVDDKPFAVYVYEDAETLRPYFCNVFAPNGVQVTRNHPPDPEADKGNSDHDTYHPGIWLAFGDIAGEDFWRNEARVRHLRFEQMPADGNEATFTVVNAYEKQDTSRGILCEETCTYTISAAGNVRWIIAESHFRALADGVYFGDQEEMGLGIRLATPLTVKHGSGILMNNLGGVNEKETWGKQADWCSYSGVVNSQRVGMVLMAAPANFRPSWFHNRDYGLMVANPFGRKSMTAPKDRHVPPDATPLAQDAPLSLGFAVCVFSESCEEHPDYAALFSHYVAYTN